jgi:hypothetical protein
MLPNYRGPVEEIPATGMMSSATGQETEDIACAIFHPFLNISRQVEEPLQHHTRLAYLPERLRLRLSQKGRENGGGMGASQPVTAGDDK